MVRLKLIKMRHNYSGAQATYLLPTGGVLMLKKVGEITDELEPSIAYKLVGDHPEELEVVADAQKAPQNKMLKAQSVRKKADS